MAKKTISEREYFEAKALYTLASIKYAEAREYERKLAELVGDHDDRGYNEWVEDGIYSRDAGHPIPFDTVLKNAEITVRPAKRRQARAR